MFVIGKLLFSDKFPEEKVTKIGLKVEIEKFLISVHLNYTVIQLLFTQSIHLSQIFLLAFTQSIHLSQIFFFASSFSSSHTQICNTYYLFCNGTLKFQSYVENENCILSCNQSVICTICPLIALSSMTNMVIVIITSRLCNTRPVHDTSTP